MVFISHDLSVVASLCDRTAVMYAGRVIEQGSALAIAHEPRHPYTVALQDSVPTLDITAAREPRIHTTQGAEDIDGRQLPGCRFAALCPSVTAACTSSPPALRELAPRHEVACLHPYSAD